MAKKFHELIMKVFPHPLIAAFMAVYVAIGHAQREDSPPAVQPAQIKSQPAASDVRSGLVNDWLRSQSSSFSAWDFGGQFRARYEHPEYLGPVDFSATGGHSSDNLMLLRPFRPRGHETTPLLNFYAQIRDSRGFFEEPKHSPRGRNFATTSRYRISCRRS